MKNTYYIKYQALADSIEFKGTLEEAMEYADKTVNTPKRT